MQLIFFWKGSGLDYQGSRGFLPTDMSWLCHLQSMLVLHFIGGLYCSCSFFFWKGFCYTFNSLFLRFFLHEIITVAILHFWELNNYRCYRPKHQINIIFSCVCLIYIFAETWVETISMEPFFLHLEQLPAYKYWVKYYIDL